MKLGLQLFTSIDTMRRAGRAAHRAAAGRRTPGTTAWNSPDFTAFRPKKSARSWTRCTWKPRGFTWAGHR